MPIEQEYDGTRYFANIVCDFCETRIRNGDGNVYWRHPNERPVSLEGPIFLHKRCSHSFEQEHRSAETWLSDELDVWLVLALEEAGYDLQKAKSRADALRLLP